MKKLFSLLLIKNFITNADTNAITVPNKYISNITKPCRLIKPRYILLGIINAINTVYTGNLALQLINGVHIIVSNRSFLFSIPRVLIIAGTAQASPLIIGITLLPLSPAFRITLSVRKLMRAM